MQVNPDGIMEVRIYDGTIMPIEEIHERIGWKENNMKYEIKEPSDIENNLISSINNLRMNPILFYETFLKQNTNTIWTEDFLKAI